MDFRIRVVIDPRQATQGAKKVERQLVNVDKRARRLGGSLRSAFAPLIGVAGAALAIRTLSSFEQEIAAVGAISQASAEQIAQFRDTAIDLGTNTRFSATQAAEGLTFLARAGFDASEALEAIDGTLKLAQAGQLGLGRAADIASNVLKGFRLEVAETARVVDVLALSANSSNTTVNQLGEALSFAAPIASGLGVSIEETTAAVSALSNAGLQGSRAGTGLNRVLANLESPTDKAKELLRDLGVEASEVRVTTVGLTGAIARLAEAGVTTGQALEIFGQRGGPAFEVLASSVPDVERFTAQFELAAGTADTLADALDDNLQGSLLALRSAFEGLILRLGESGATGALRGIVDAATEGFRFLAENAETLRNVGIGLSLVIGGNLVTSFAAAAASSLTANAALNLTALSSTRLAVALRAVPLVAIATGLVAVTAAALDAAEEFKQLTEATQEATVAGEFYARTDYSITLTFLARANDRLTAATKAVEEAQRQGGEVADDLVRRQELAQQSVDTYTEAVKRFEDASASSREEVDAYTQAVDKQVSSVKQIVAQFEAENEVLLLNSREREIQLQLLEQIAAIEEKSGASISDEARAELEDAIRRNQSLQEQAAILDDLRGSQTEYVTSFRALQELRKAGIITNEQFAEKLKEIQTAYLGSNEAQAESVVVQAQANEQGKAGLLITQATAFGLQAAAQAAQQYVEQQNSIVRGTRAALGPTEFYAQTQRDLKAALDAGRISSEQYTIATNNLAISTRTAGSDIGSGLEAGLARVQNQILDTSSIVEQGLVSAFNNAEDALVEFLTTGEADFSQFVDSLLEDITRLLVRQALIGALGFGGVPGFADGGQVSGGKPILVGEEGPELFIPPSSGRIASNPETRDLLSQGSGGGAASVNIVNVLDPELVSSALASSGGEQIILNVIRNNASTVRQSIS